MAELSMRVAWDGFTDSLRIGVRLVHNPRYVDDVVLVVWRALCPKYFSL